MLTREQLDQHNADYGNLDYSDTQELLRIQELLESNQTETALAKLDEFVAERGYNELQIDKNGEDL